MWWDWTEITLLDSVLFSLLALLTLYLVGSGILRLIYALSKKADPFGSFDFLVKTNFRIFFGFIFIFLFVLIFSTFNLSFSESTLIIITIAIIGFAATRHNINLKLPKKIRLRSYAPVIAVFIILLTSIFLSSLLISNHYGSTNDDGADHTLMIRIILDNPNALITHISQPYANFALYYPLSAHTLCAFFMTLEGVLIQKIVIMVSAILPCLIVLSIYCAMKCLFEKKSLSILGSIIAAFFTIGLSYSPISWGGLPVLLSFYVSICSMGLIFVFLLKEKLSILNALFLGLIFFITSQTYPVALLFVTLWFLLVSAVKVFPKSSNITKLSGSIKFRRKNIYIIVAFLVPILLSVPYFESVYVHNVAGHQFRVLSSAVDMSAEAVKANIGFNWLFDIPALSVFFSDFGQLLALASYSLILIFLFLIPQISKRISSIFPSREYLRSFLLIYSFLLTILFYLTLTLYLPINFLSVYLTPERVWQHIFILATILTAFVIFSTIYFSILFFKRLFQKNQTTLGKLNKNRWITYTFLALLIFNAGLLSIPSVKDQQVQYNKIAPLINTYETLNQSDLSLMNWIKENIPSTEQILVSAGDSGQFLTPITQVQTISRNSYLANYLKLMTIITSNSSDLNAVPIMVGDNVSYVYIGSIATSYALQNPYYRHFNATQFLLTPYFTLTKEVGDAWLFQFNLSAALSAYKAAVSLPESVDQWHSSTYINILTSEGGYTNPIAGIYYGTGVLPVYAFGNESYKLDHWMLNGSYLSGPQNPVVIDYLNWTIQPVFIKMSEQK